LIADVAAEPEEDQQLEQEPEAGRTGADERIGEELPDVALLPDERRQAEKGDEERGRVEELERKGDEDDRDEDDDGPRRRAAEAERQGGPAAAATTPGATAGHGARSSSARLSLESSGSLALRAAPPQAYRTQRQISWSVGFLPYIRIPTR